MKIQVPDFSCAHIVVFGDVMLDRYWHGNTHRISPEAPVPIVHVRDVVECPGGAGNVALNIAALGAKVNLFGTCGNDEAAVCLSEKLTANKVEHHLLHIDGLPTITKLRVLSFHQQLLRLDFEESFANIDNSQLIQSFIASLSTAKAVILSDYGKGGLRDPQVLIEAARKAKVPVLVDPKRKDFEVYRGATLITPNFKEFQTVVGVCKDEQEIYTKGLALIAKYDLEALLVTRGERGMTLIRSNYPPLTIPTGAREVYDVTGAGDTVVATFAASLAAGCDFPLATRLANIAAGLVVGKLGAASVSVNELKNALLRQNSTVIETDQKGVTIEETLLTMTARAKEREETVVFASGLFDILHENHLDYLQQAKALGDRLIVAIPDDESVQKYQKNQPIHNIKQRMAVIASLDMVDWVVSYSEKTPEHLIGRLLPDILIRGFHESSYHIAGSKAVLYNDGLVHELANFQDYAVLSMAEEETV